MSTVQCVWANKIFKNVVFKSYELALLWCFLHFRWFALLFWSASIRPTICCARDQNSGKCCSRTFFFSKTITECELFIALTLSIQETCVWVVRNLLCHAFFYNLCVDAHIQISTSKPWKQSVYIVTAAVIFQNGIVVLAANNAINVDQSMRVCCKESFDSNLLARTFHACGCCNLQYCKNNTNNLFILPSRSSWKNPMKLCFFEVEITDNVSCAVRLLQTILQTIFFVTCESCTVSVSGFLLQKSVGRHHD